ncbi:hypothetical protein M427DRAFT_192300 [Gonapodya prolifera JEL478]|uniref:Nitrogen regulatory protein areA GATA-like domain-containing protein n=1 Tax=Gonapodya prolifera (strain JEL478) TaxID=1344416 RepID=A0A139A020_GONPJ|nr:hypothetical protein M427DRAFT_192300 [Gonapodya prolifera JEL478]|eukprot:KXS10109.1 hypothetical protein M427DRAFT_192300 [Gonapodya prolifera JEL478]
MPQDQYSTVVLPPVAVADDADQIFEERALAVQLGQSHVDYLSHALDERDLQKSWRYANKHRDLIFNGRRLENASWRRWFQEKFHLRKLDPADLNW